jgi:hypothetical protein
MYDDLIVYSFYNRLNYCILYKLGVLNKGVIRLYDPCIDKSDVMWMMYGQK